MIKFQQAFPESLSFINDFLDPNSKRPKYVFGTNHEAEQIAKQVELNGFVDDLKEEKVFLGLPVNKSEELPKDALVVIVALMRPLTIQKRLLDLGVDHLHYIALMRFSPLKLAQPWFWTGFDADFIEYKPFYEHFDGQLADKESIKVYESIINFRLTGDLKYLKGFEDRQANQYFESFLSLKDGENFVDIGGFDGKTAIEFVNRCPNYNKIHLFEPEKSNMTTAKEVCAGVRGLVFHPCGISDKEQVLGIKVGGSTSKIVSKGLGDYDIQLKRLDDVLKDETVSFIKMDIEGAEQTALKGCEHIIKAQQPKLAICVYHQGNDMRVIFDTVKKMNQGYKVYIRHYTEGVVETVMFFI